MTKSVAIIGTRGYPSYYGGFETLVRQLGPYLVEQGWDVTVYGRPNAVKSNDITRDERVRTVNTRGIESKSLSTLSYGLTSCVDSFIKKPDAALVMNVANGYWLPLLKARGIPTIVNVDGIEWERAKWGRAAKSVFKSGAHMTAKFADHLVFDSQEIARRWRNEFRRSGEFIPYGGNVPEDSNPLKEFARRSYALMVARFVPENTVEEFFDAAENLAKRWDVVIVGSSGYGGDLDERADRLANSNDRIHWLGHISDDRQLFALWQNAGVYFHGHSVGGTNPALVQAMACGVPIVARDTVYNREVLDEAGILVPPSGEAITEALDRVLSDSTLQDDLTARVLVRRDGVYTWENVCKLYAEQLDEAVR
ncbi:glycosyltransferase [Rhodococcus sp. NPDC060086]|uniref:glycosyltransferase n=1 Tax=Rhodococcus sp. NPDC060086 TaxID=3347055 RepID=UPI003657407F